MTEADIRLQLAEEDDEAAVEGEVPLHEISPSSMLFEMLDIEDQQYVLVRAYLPYHLIVQ